MESLEEMRVWGWILFGAFVIFISNAVLLVICH